MGSLGDLSLQCNNICLLFHNLGAQFCVYLPRRIPSLHLSRAKYRRYPETNYDNASLMEPF